MSTKWVKRAHFGNIYKIFIFDAQSLKINMGTEIITVKHNIFVIDLILQIHKFFPPRGNRPIEYNTLAKLKLSRKCKNEAFAKFDIREIILLYRITVYKVLGLWSIVW